LQLASGVAQATDTKEKATVPLLDYIINVVWGLSHLLKK
jgi:hypothetical protein